MYTLAPLTEQHKQDLLALLHLAVLNPQGGINVAGAVYYFKIWIDQAQPLDTVQAD